MRSHEITFESPGNKTLAAKITLPDERFPENFALFAHCFTCSKDFHPVRYVSSAMAAQGMGVLTFDFTGLGESEGDFADTNFSSNLEDLLAAAAYLRENYTAPSLVVGHSLGGAAAIYAAGQLDSVRAIATIGAPADITHVKHFLRDKLDIITREGEAVVSLEGRKFRVKRHFLADLQKYRLLEALKEMRKPLLIMHSPQDLTVDIEHAEDLYNAAFHPKSFISLDGANHLLTDKKDAKYAGKVIAAWAGRYLSGMDDPD